MFHTLGALQQLYELCISIFETCTRPLLLIEAIAGVCRGPDWLTAVLFVLGRQYSL